jgi:hypothetical protein
MAKPVAVFSYDANPNIDPPQFHVSRAAADDMCDRLRSHVQLSGRAIRFINAPPGALPSPRGPRGLFGQYWHRAPSGPLRVEVMQMRRRG